MTTDEYRTHFGRMYIGLAARLMVDQLIDDLAEARDQATMRLHRLQQAWPLLGLGDYDMEEEEGYEPDGTTYTDATTGAVLCAACQEPDGIHLRGCVHGATLEHG